MTKHWTLLVTALLALLLALFAPAPVARADIFQWQYINPADPTQGKQQSTTLCPDGAGANAVSGAYLSTRNLTMAYLIGSDLSGALAQGANFTNADLSHANLTSASFDPYFDVVANLTGANLSQANLTNASFYQATLTGADLTGAQIRGAFLNRVTGFTSAQLYSTASYQNRDLTGIQLGGDNLNLSGWNFAGQNLTSAGFEYATLTGATLTGANLTATYFNHSILSDADLTGATFTSSSFDEATLSNTNLSNTSLTGVSFYLANLTGANLTGANIRGAWLTDTTGLTLAQIYSTASYQNHDLTGIRLDGNNLAGGYFAGQNLTNASFIQAALNNGNFSGANLAGAIFNGATLTGANLAGSEVRGAYFANTTSSGFTSAQLYSTASYAAHDLTGIDLSYNNVAGWNFAGQNLTGASFSHATLQNTDLRQTNLTNSNFSYGTLTGANFSGADVRGANFLTQINGSNDVTAAQLYSTVSYQNHDLSGIGLGYSNLSGSNFAGQNLTNASFSGGLLSNTDLHGANLTNANFDGANLTGANVTGAEVRGANFHRGGSSGGVTIAQLYSTASYQAHDLTGIGLDADFSTYGFDFSGANFAGQNLTNANFQNAKLAGANFTGSQVRGANFGSTVEAGFSPTQLYSTASYQNHDLTGIRLPNNILAAWNFAGQNLTNANLSFANLSNADFSQANLTNTYFQPYSGTVAGANLSGADARGSDLSDSFVDSATTNNLIHSDGHIAGLDLAPDASLAVRYYAGDPSRGLGPIPVIVQDHVTLGNGSALAVNGGTLRFTLTSGSPTIGTGVSAAVSSGATLELAGSVSALANGAGAPAPVGRVNVTNNSTAPGILVSGTHQQVGNIDGSGTTQVNAGSDLTANHIIQSALVIGGSAGSPAFVTIDASDAMGNPLVQLSGFALAGSLTGGDPFKDDSISSSNFSSSGQDNPAPIPQGNSVAGGYPSSVPEPSTLLLVLVAITGLVAFRRYLGENPAHPLDCGPPPSILRVVRKPRTTDQGIVKN